jgi:hypothetical protein
LGPSVLQNEEHTRPERIESKQDSQDRAQLVHGLAILEENRNVSVPGLIEEQPAAGSSYVTPGLRVKSLLNSRSHSTELATAAQRSQSPTLKFTVENACCRNGM